MEIFLFSPLKLGIILRLIAGVVLMHSLPKPADLGHPQAFLEKIQSSSQLQNFLEHTVHELASKDRLLRESKFTVSLIDLNFQDGPRLAHIDGDQGMFPASVVKFIYLMAAFRWQEEGRLQIDTALKRQLTLMIHNSSNQATQWVFWKLTGADPGAELTILDYLSFRDRRMSIKRWVQSLGIEGLHCVHPTYDSRYEIYGREAQFFNDTTIPDGGKGEGFGTHGKLYNRLMLSANGTAKLLALLAENRALTPKNCAMVREMMRRDVREQPYLGSRIAGGASRLPGMEVFSKSGTYGSFFADAGIIRHVSGRQIILVVYIESKNKYGYRGRFIADLTEKMAEELLLNADHSGMDLLKAPD